MVILDTDILIWILRGDKNLKKSFDALAAIELGHLYITPIQIAEIFAGVKDKERMATEAFINSFHSIHLDTTIGTLAGEFLRKYQKSHNVTIADALIAASAAVNNANLWTLNTKHYPMIPQKNIYIPSTE